MLIAVVSDTHALLRPQVLPAIASADQILHAGDVGNIEILDTLRTIAPVTSIRGNIDMHGPCAQLPATEAIELEGHFIYMLHNLADLDLSPEAAHIQVVIYGHSHHPSITHKNQVLYLNPGSIGPRRFNLPTTLAMLHLTPGSAPTAEIVALNI